MIFIGVDPGKSGGLAGLAADGRVVFAVKMPETEREVLDALGPYVGAAVAVLEFVRSRPGQGVASMFSFGRNYGGLRMALTAARISFSEITPAKWQAALGCLSGGDKNITKQAAAAMFPGVKVTHAIADALLLAECARRRSVGDGRRL